MGKLPDRWLAYEPIGKRIPGTRFICFKAPLKDKICSELVVGHRFTPQMMRERLPSVKLVVDLTNTDRYYSGQTEFTKVGIKYKKIRAPGHVIPPCRIVNEFFYAVDSFVSSSADDESLIGVHCTHGLNRTSYFVVSYMINKLGFEPKAAMKAFEEARGHKIERQNYIDDLLKRGMGSMLTTARATSRPSAYRRWNKSPVDVDAIDLNRTGRAHASLPHNVHYPQRHAANVHPYHGQNYESRDHFHSQPQSFRPSGPHHNSHGSGFASTSIRPSPYGKQHESQTPVLPPALTYAEHRTRRDRHISTATPGSSYEQPSSWRPKAPASEPSSSSRHRPQLNVHTYFPG